METRIEANFSKALEGYGSIEKSGEYCFFCHVKKTNRHGKEQHRVLCLDYKNRAFVNIHKGKPRKVYLFDSAIQVQRALKDPFALYIIFKTEEFDPTKQKIYNLVLALQILREELYHRISDIINYPHIGIMSQNGSVILSNGGKKEGSHHFAGRWLVLYKYQLHVHRSKGDSFPTNVVDLRAVSVEQKEKRKLVVKTKFRDFCIKLSNPDVAGEWLHQLQQLSSEAAMGQEHYTSYDKQIVLENQSYDYEKKKEDMKIANELITTHSPNAQGEEAPVEVAEKIEDISSSEVDISGEKDP